MPYLKILTLLLTGLLVAACSSNGSEYATQQLSTTLSERCMDDYFSASASHRTRRSSAEDCDVQARNKEITDRMEGNEYHLPLILRRDN